MRTTMPVALGTRVSKSVRREFVRKAKKETGMSQSDILRAMIHAYLENRLTIKPKELECQSL